jgi:hypothetical protein
MHSRADVVQATVEEEVEMDKLQQGMAWVVKHIGLVAAALTLTQNLVEKRHKKATKAHEKQIELQKEADVARKEGHVQRAKQLDAQAMKKHSRYLAIHASMRTTIQHAKDLNAQLNNLHEKQAEIATKIEKIKKSNKIKIKGNKVSGGTKEQRLAVCAVQSSKRCGTGARRNFYSQAGTWDVDRCLTGEPYGHRSDCSSWYTSVFKSCGLEDPNGNSFHGGFTGTLVSHGKQVSREYAMHHPGVAVIYGSGDGHHVELSLGDGSTRTIGHGSAPIDLGTFDMLGGVVRYFAYV